jgi:predicted nucleic acid-binding protein
MPDLMPIDTVLLDTNVVSVFLKTSEVHEESRRKIEEALTGKIALISFVTVAEMFYWAERHNWSEKKRASLDERLRAYGILDPTRSTSDIWAKTKRACEKLGRPRQPHDLWIAAAAIEHGLEVTPRILDKLGA